MLDVMTETARKTAASAPCADNIYALTAALSHLSDVDLEDLEDDLNFFAFTGITSARIESVLEKSDFASASAIANTNARSPMRLAG